MGDIYTENSFALHYHHHHFYTIFSDTDHVMSSSTLRLLPLHENRDFYEHVLELLNDEWPQSKTIRMRRLERSCNDLPLSYILLGDQNQLIGYCYVDRMFNEEQSVIVESVCIQRNLRGHG